MGGDDSFREADGVVVRRWPPMRSCGFQRSALAATPRRVLLDEHVVLVKAKLTRESNYARAARRERSWKTPYLTHKSKTAMMVSLRNPAHRLSMEPILNTGE
jgi:hypothetical protein